MPDLGGAADQAKQHGQGNPEKVDRAKDKATDALDGKKDGDQK